MKLKLYFLLITVLFSGTSIIAQNNALSFDGTDDYIDCGTINLSGSSLTLECWINAYDFDNPGHGCISLIGTETGNGSTALLRLGDGGLNLNKVQFVLQFGGTQQKLLANTALSANTWYHIAGVYNSTTGMEVYINGVSDISYSQSGSFISNGPFLIGNITAYGPDVRNFHGKIDEVRIWNDERTETEIRQNMYRELPNLSGEANLLAYYKLNETSGITAEDFKGSNDGTLTNMTGNEWQTSSAFFGPKNCLDFDGSNDYVLMDNTSAFVGYTELTVEACVYPTSSSGWHEIYQLYPNNITLALSGLGLYAFINDNALGSANSISIGNAVDLNQWNHVALTWKQSTSTLTIYANGKELGSISNASNEALVAGTAGPYIGALVAGNELFQGKIDEVRVWNTVRTLEQLRSSMFKSINGNESGLVSYYNFDNSSGTTLQDFSGNENDGTLQNMDNNDWVNSLAFNTWLNTSSTNPATTTNWSRGSSPTSSDNVGIYNLSGVDPLITSSFDCNNFYLENGASFTMNDGSSFIAEGNEYFNGTFTYNKTITDGVWHLISAPIENATSAIFEGEYLQSWSEPNDIWTEITTTDTPLTPGEGFGLWGISKAGATTYSFNGTPNTGGINYGITYTSVDTSSNDGANLIGNPYPSAIDWDGLRTTYGAVYYWNGSGYVSWNNGGSGSQYVAPAQGFFIITGSNGTFSLTNANRTHTGASSFYKSTESIENGIVLQAGNNNYKDETWISCNDQSQEDFELDKDAWKLMTNLSGISQIYSLCSVGNLSIDVRPETEIIQLGFANDQSGSYSIAMSQMNGIAKAQLEDTKLNQFHDLTKGAYSFDWNNSDLEERFILHLKATGTTELEAQAAQVYTAGVQVYIRMNEQNQYHQVMIYDLAGRLIYESQLIEQSLQTIDLNQLSGAYLVQLVGENQTQTEKIVL